MADLDVRKVRVVSEETRHTGGRSDGPPLRKAAACAVVANPYAGREFASDLSAITDASAALGTDLGARCLAALGGDAADSYGKAGIVGTAGEQEHVHAALTSVFGNTFREAIGGATAWITSTKKIAAPGTAIDVPLAFTDDVWVRSHYDTVTVSVPDAPLPDEMVVIAAVANRGRLNARVGGKTREEALGGD